MKQLNNDGRITLIWNCQLHFHITEANRKYNNYTQWLQNKIHKNKYN